MIEKQNAHNKGHNIGKNNVHYQASLLSQNSKLFYAASLYVKTNFMFLIEYDPAVSNQLVSVNALRVPLE